VSPQYFFFFVFLGLNLQPMEIPRLGVKLELQLPAYITATATSDQSDKISRDLILVFPQTGSCACLVIPLSRA
ncbi:hypothetical protein PSZ92_23630, partial [Shigella sonnei]|nr:hypothetical protein [Shigella sonnei]